MIQHRLVEHEIEQPADLDRAIAEIAPNGYELSLLDRDDDGFRVRLVETETSTARNINVPAELLASPIYSHVRRAYARLAEIVGLPPFAVTVGKEAEVAETYDGLRDEGARRREAGHPALALQGPRRDERRAALGDDDGSGASGC